MRSFNEVLLPMHIFQQVVFIQIGFTDYIVILVYHTQYSCFEIPVFQNLKIHAVCYSKLASFI